MKSGALTIELVCAGCGTPVSPKENAPYTCPRSAPGEEHVLTRDFHDESLRGENDWEQVFLDSEPNPFLKYRFLHYAYRMARLRGLHDEDYVGLVSELDDAVAAVDGRGFRATPFAPNRHLADALRFDSAGALWIKNETVNVSGSHKARHLMGILLWMEVVRRTAYPPPPEGPLAIASCGNAALAAAVVARAGERPLTVFIPPHADPHVVEGLTAHGARLVRCERRDGEPGDPCYLRFLEDLESGALPFTVQSNRNALNLEGGLTLGYEMASELLRRGEILDALVIQVGGGALAASAVQGLREAVTLGLLPELPRIYLVQSEGAHPLSRAYDRVVDCLLKTDAAASKDNRRERARQVLALPVERVNGAIHHAAHHRPDYMWPWEDEPHSVATGILDDETYDWLADVGDMLQTGGFPVVVSEGELHEAHHMAHQTTDIAVEPTGTAGLAGVLQLRRTGVLTPKDRVALLFTGIER